jgi:hypothetical protein
MKPLIRIAALTLFLTIPRALFAQDEIDKFLQESIPDAEKLITAYANPLMKSLTLGLNQGWYNTAKPHKIAGVDLTITVSAMTIPTSENSFNVSKLNLVQLELDPASPGYPNAPTITGSEDAPTFRLKSDHSATFEGPPGLDLKENLKRNIIPVPVAHLGFGLPKNTDLKTGSHRKLNLATTAN